MATFRSDIPSPQVVAAIVAAIELCWPRERATAPLPQSEPSWRFSGRSWRHPWSNRPRRPW